MLHQREPHSVGVVSGELRASHPGANDRGRYSWAAQVLRRDSIETLKLDRQ